MRCVREDGRSRRVGATRIRDRSDLIEGANWFVRVAMRDIINDGSYNILGCNELHG